MAATSTPAPAHEIIKVPDVGHAGRDALKQQCIDVRIAVFVHEQGFPLELEIDDHDETAIHVLLRLVPSLEPVGTVRGYRAKSSNGAGGEQDHYKLSRLAVLAAHRQHRFGRVLVLALHDCIQQDAAAVASTSTSTSATTAHTADADANTDTDAHILVVSHAQIPVVPFYAKYGYVAEGDEFDEDGAPHRRMVAKLSTIMNLK